MKEDRVELGRRRRKGSGAGVAGCSTCSDARTTVWVLFPEGQSVLLARKGVGRKEKREGSDLGGYNRDQRRTWCVRGWVRATVP